MSYITSLEDNTRIAAVVRIFIICYNILDNVLDEGPVPSWTQQYNMLFLLNLLDMLRKCVNGIRK